MVLINSDNTAKKGSLSPLGRTKWDTPRADHYGYCSDEERRSKRGLEEWEMVVDHTPQEIDPATSKWLHITLWLAAVVSAALYLADIDIHASSDGYWFIGAYRQEAFVTIFFFIFLYSSMVIKLIFDNGNDGEKPAERRVLITVFLGVLAAIVYGIMQLFFGYLV